jgi:hypothetical protein
VGSVFIENGPGPYVSIGRVLDKANDATRLKSGAIRQQELLQPGLAEIFALPALGESIRYSLCVSSGPIS